MGEDLRLAAELRQALRDRRQAFAPPGDHVAEFMATAGGHHDGGRGPIPGSRKGVASHPDYGFSSASTTFRTGEIADMKITRIGNDSVCYISIALAGRYRLDYRGQQ